MINTDFLLIKLEVHASNVAEYFASVKQIAQTL